MTAPEHPLDYSTLKAEMRLCGDWGDPWGTCMHWWFEVAEEMHFSRPHLGPPDAWRFRPSPFGRSGDPDDFARVTVALATDAALVAFGALIDRYARLLKHLGRDY